MSPGNLDLLLFESQRIFDLAVLVRRVDENPAHGAPLARKALILLAQVIAGSYERSQEDVDATLATAHDLNLEHQIVDLQLKDAVSLLGKLAARFDETPAAVTEQERSEYDRLLGSGPRIYLQAAQKLRRGSPGRSRSLARSGTIAGVSLVIIIGLGSIMFRLISKDPDLKDDPSSRADDAVSAPSVGPVPKADPQSLLEQTVEPPAVTLPTKMQLKADGAAQGPVGNPISVAHSRGVYKAIIEARGTSCVDPALPAADPKSKYPALEMRIDGKVTFVWYLDSEATKSYASEPFSMDDASHTVRFFFTNDFYAAGRCDRNVWLDGAAFELAGASHPPAAAH